MLTSSRVIISVIRRKRKVLGEISNYKVQLEVVKAKIKSAKSKDESESLKFTQKNLINKMPRFLLLLNISELSLRYCSPPLFQSNKMSIKNLVTASVCTTRKSS
ncbi:uncharacterized protein [Arachis hypogaea]|uniref:uncharacterized protein isoform X2 n=1 Tax=Arachis hypogaea TaxID=3818 RepID=UPI003B213E80